jgi:hypothetical protein
MKDIKDLGIVPIPNLLGKNITNIKELYIVVTDELPADKKVKSSVNKTIYLSTRLDETAAAIKIAGYEITHNTEIIAKLKDANSYNEAVELAKENKLESQNLIFPWCRILQIKTLKYTIAK